MNCSSVTAETAWMSAERAWYQTSPFGSPVRSIMRGTSATCQKIVPSSSSSTLSDVRTLYSKKAYCARRSILLIGTLYATCLALRTMCCSASSLDVADDQYMVTSSQCGGRKKAVPLPAPEALPEWKWKAPKLSRTMATSCGCTRTSLRTSTISSSASGKKRPLVVISRCWPLALESTSTAVSSSTLTASLTPPSAASSCARGKTVASPRSTRSVPVVWSSSLRYWCFRTSYAWLMSPTVSYASGKNSVGPDTTRFAPVSVSVTCTYCSFDSSTASLMSPTVSYVPGKKSCGPVTTRRLPVSESVTTTYCSFDSRTAGC
mmetsp:Transcript_39332/g.92001  ORF Transcript_39332/g.92001 Transcript_39332/m.92001 type:complete len:319 (-) Transcript_39332:599-1555(-)